MRGGEDRVEIWPWIGRGKKGGVPEKSGPEQCSERAAGGATPQQPHVYPELDPLLTQEHYTSHVAPVMEP